LQDPEIAFQLNSVPQGVGADLLATLDGYSRADVDALALESQPRAAHARDTGLFDRSAVPVRDINGLTVLSRDEFIKPTTTLEGLAKLKTSFDGIGSLGYDDIALRKYTTVERINHVHTPGNSSGIVDGASAVFIGSERA